MAAAHVPGLKDAGVKVLDSIEVPTDSVTFGPLVVKALDQKPDGIIFACNAEKIAKIIKELKGKNQGSCLILPRNMFRAGDEVMLDGITIAQLENELNVKVLIVDYTGEDLIKTINKALKR